MRGFNKNWILGVATSAGLIASLGCGAGGGNAKFPSASEIEAIGRAPAPPKITNAPVRDVDAWELRYASAEPVREVPHSPANQWEKLLAQVANERQGLVWVSEPMTCLAREIGTFYLEKQGVPGDDLTRFMASRCGVTASHVGTAFIGEAHSGAASDDTVFARMRVGTEQLLSKALADGNQSAGIWFGQDPSHAVAMLVFAPRRVRFSSFPAAPGPDGRYLIRGELLIPAERIRALVNDGAYGFRNCTTDETTRLPHFVIDCPTNRNDDSATLEIAAFEPGRVMGPLVSSVILWPKGIALKSYAPASYAATLQNKGGATLSTTLISMLNQVRTQAGLAPVSLADAESQTATRVAPHFFASMAGLESAQAADLIVLGLRAGWQIPGLVGNGLFTSAMARGVDNPAQLLVSALARPSGREALLDRDVRVVAVGPVVSKEENLLAAVFSSYTMLAPTANAKEVREVARLLNEKRRQKRLAPVIVVDELLATAAGSARALERGEREPEASLEDLLGKTARALGPGSQGWFLWAPRLEEIVLPPMLTSAPSLRVVIGTAHFKPKESPWGGYAVLVAAAAPSGTSFASLGTPPAL